MDACVRTDTELRVDTRWLHLVNMTHLLKLLRDSDLIRIKTDQLSPTVVLSAAEGISEALDFAMKEAHGSDSRFKMDFSNQ
jgi:hypothetical protein